MPTWGVGSGGDAVDISTSPTTRRATRYGLPGARSGLSPPGRLDEHPEPGGERVVERPLRGLPGPVARVGARGVHPRIAPENEQVLCRYDGQPGPRRHGEP